MVDAASASATAAACSGCSCVREYQVRQLVGLEIPSHACSTGRRHAACHLQTQRAAFALLLLGMTDACCPLFSMQLALVKGKELHWTEYGVGGGTCQSGNCVAEVRLSRLYQFWKLA